MPLTDSDEYRAPWPSWPARPLLILAQPSGRTVMVAGVVRVGEVDHGHLAGLREHEGGVVARLDAPGVEPAVVGGEGVLRLALVHDPHDLAGRHLQRAGSKPSSSTTIVWSTDRSISSQVGGGGRAGVGAAAPEPPPTTRSSRRRRPAGAAHHAARCSSRRGRNPMRCTPDALEHLAQAAVAGDQLVVVHPGRPVAARARSSGVSTAGWM